MNAPGPGRHALVTGGAGFIGSHLVETLLQLGCRVRVLDDFSTGRRANLPDDPRLEIQEGSVADPDAVGRAAAGASTIFHLAAIASVGRSIADPRGTHRVNYGGTVAVLEAARRWNVPRTVIASSAAVYGDADAPRRRETDETHPLSPYAVDKLASEAICDFYRDRYSVRCTALRFFNVFGPRQDPASDYSGVVSIFFDYAARNAAPTIYGDGEQTRDFVHVTDVAGALVAAASVLWVPALDAVNIGSGKATSIRELWREIATLTGAAATPKHAAARSGDIRRSCADISRAVDLLGWRPRTDLATGLAGMTAERDGRRRTATAR